MSKIEIVFDDELDESLGMTADAIINIAEAFEKLKKSGLKPRAIAVLIHDSCGKKVNLSDIEVVLKHAARLKDHFIEQDIR